MIILIGGEKGGTGKTTLSTNLAIKLALNNKKILLVDTDKQASASSWCASREMKDYKPKISCIKMEGKGIGEQINNLSQHYDYVIVDVNGRDSIELRASMVVADIFIIPIQASQFDVWTLGTIDELVGMVKPLNDKLKTYILINRASTNPGVNEAKEVEDIVIDFDYIKLLPVILCERIIFRKAAKSGLSIFELKNKDIKAITEFDAIYNEIFRE